MTPAELAALSARAYLHMSPWSEADFAETLAQPVSLLTELPGAFVLGQVVLDEAEIFALATDPLIQRQGAGRKVLAAFENAAMTRGARDVFLEVAAANAQARAFYIACGYHEAGRRRNYYRKADGTRDDALLMRKALTSG